MSQFILTKAAIAETEGDQLFSVRLIDRRTGEVPNVNGVPLSLLTMSPRAAVSAFMQGRDQHVWRTEIEPVPSLAGRSHGAAF
ncbi:hypothetical protein JWJ88_17455 [Paracoccus methylovorus]|uniref:Uncharacterized protein n=1 Tax=Paracoccus methylovorus TaxID=2812658 RepID=A0ABX7JLF1_9RHOB|nr:MULTISPECIES: hypothetical protein [Paracoccus]QRZ14751.1 hypothetical protein JWJ88_17455 [Paracoccus methylovorus]